MKIFDFINTDFFNLPKVRPDGLDFKIYVFQVLDEFISKLEGLCKSDDFFEDINYSIDSVLERQQHLISQIKKTIDNYYDGKPASALKSLEDGLLSNHKNFEEVMHQYRFERNSDFYRIRTCNENYVIPSQDFFHIPFHLRGKVKTQRFSIPGFPSLYLGTTLYVCWEELKRPNIDSFQAVRLKNTKDIRVLNLVPQNEKNKSPSKHYNYLMLWPLIFTTSIKVKNNEDTFKPEYIIPQLLLQWVRNSQKLDGIMYQTTHIDFRNYCFDGEFINVVLPVKENKTEGLCNILKEMFEMTTATSIQLNDLSSGNLVDGSNFIDPNVNKKIRNLEIVKGRVFPYNHSKLGELESILLKMITKPI